MTQNGPQTKPPAFGGLLFRTLGNDEETNQPLAFGEEASPFSPAPNAGEVPLTVADVLPQLPPDLARATSVPQDQPVQISPSILNQALSSGQLTIPLFEVYRVCPGIFQAPVSPDDTRTVRLPASKLSSLVTLAAATPAPSQVPASPFTAQSLPPQSPAAPFVASPFDGLLNGANTPPQAPGAVAAEARPGATTLPPRRDPAQPPAMSIPPATLFQAVPPPATQPAQSPFGTLETSAPPVSAPPSPFPTQPVSPFAVVAPAPTEPPARAATPLSLFAAVESPEPPAILPYTAFAEAPPANPPTQSLALAGPATASVATLLKGQHPDELGFDPAMIPSWITTQFHGGIVADLQTMEQPTIELGAIVDGITDIGFRNVLHSAQRNHLVPVSIDSLTPIQSPTLGTESPQLSTVTPVALPRGEPPVAGVQTTGSFAAPPPAPPEPQAHSLRVEPGNPFAQVPDAPPAAPPPQPVQEPAPPSAASSFIQPISSGLEQFTAAIAAFQPAAPTPPPVDTGVPPVKQDPPAQTPFTGFPQAMDPFAPADEPSLATTADRTGFSSFDLMGGAPSHEPSAPGLFPEGSEPPAFIKAEVPEIPLTVEKTEVQGGTQSPGIGAPGWSFLPQEIPPAQAPQTFEAEPAAVIAKEPLIARKPEPVVSAAAPELFTPPTQPSSPASMFSATVPATPRQPAAATKPSMGLSAVSSGAEEQLMLRALLGTDEELTIARVMELTVGLPGITACALIKGEQVLAGESTKGSDARAFRTQAAEVARSLRTLAPLIGIADAETFTLNTESRLITLCFPGTVTLAILHDREPSLGLRDKLTLIARQLEHMVA